MAKMKRHPTEENTRRSQGQTFVYLRVSYVVGNLLTFTHPPLAMTSWYREWRSSSFPANVGHRLNGVLHTKQRCQTASAGPTPSTKSA